MSVTGLEFSDNLAARSLSQISELSTVRIGVDLVSAARRTVGFLRHVSECHWLHHQSTIVEAIRRYEELWMPLIADLTVGMKPAMVLPPIDVEWVWFCHTLNPVSYRQYCESRFSKLIGKPAIFDVENKEYAILRCKKLWVQRYPNESFENEMDPESHDTVVKNEDLLTEVKKRRSLYDKFSAPYMCEIVYLIAARQRYKGLLLLLQKFVDECARFVPTLDILLMWLTHQSYPTVYEDDLKDMLDDMETKVVGLGETVKEEDMEKTKELWDRTFNQPYEKAGGGFSVSFDGLRSFDPPFNWVVSDADVNTIYKSVLPRFLLEVCVFIRLNSNMASTQTDIKQNFLRLKVPRCYRKLKLDNPISKFTHEQWQKTWHVYCEFGTRGLILEHRRRGGKYFRRSKLRETIGLYWNDLLRAESLSLAKLFDQQFRVVASVTPPVQAAYLLKCVPDRVTDDSGAMISDVILRMNNYRPQEGRWLSRTVLDHAGRECFVVRIRIGRGFYRRGGEAPSLVKWEERITEIREGSWSYVAGSIGRAPEKIVGTAMPKEPPEQWQAAWRFSTGDELMIRWDSSASTSGLDFCLRNHSSPDSSVRLLTGRKMQYRVKRNEQTGDNKEESEEEEEEEESFVTLVRSTEENPTGKATALINWKLLAVEFVPEEDAVYILLLCISILRSVSAMRKEDVGNLLVRRRLKEAKLGDRDWGSVVIHSPLSAASSSPYVRPWYWNAGKVLVQEEAGNVATRQPVLNYSHVEGGDLLYKQEIISRDK